MDRHCLLVLWIFFLQVLAGPDCQRVVQNPPSLTIHEGDYTTINCTFQKGSERLAAIAEFFQMPDDKNPLNNSMDGRVTFTSTDMALVMTIHEAVICDSGVYLCKVKFYKGEPCSSNGTRLTVLASKYPKKSAVYSQTEMIVDVIRLGLLALLVLLTFVLLCKFW
ncbi:T-cell antigen CD7-like [Engystomops pustulosus]|uniref:T-cell antigen CD7-like n=1 Tax=Engystomops pustulosus TaxID=76066 RepID=UPI003AFA464D